jgi:hypothetical protein
MGKYYEAELFKKSSEQASTSEFRKDCLILTILGRFIENMPGYKSKKESLFDFIPEMRMIERVISYKEVYHTITRFTQNSLIFHNYLKYNINKNATNSISTIFIFPYTPEYIINYANDTFIVNFAQYLNMIDTYPNEERVRILKQKLLDVYYTVEDAEDFNMVVACRSSWKDCGEVAS